MKKIDTDKLNFILIAVIICFYAFGIQLATNISIALLFITAIITTKDAWSKIKASFSDIRIWCFYSIFLLAVLGLINTENMKEGLRYVEQRVAFMLLPLPIYLIAPSRKQVNKLLLIFAACCVLISIASLINAYMTYLETADASYFYSDWLAYIVDSKSTYLSLYVNFAIFVICYFYYNGAFVKNWQRFLAIVCAIQLVVFNFLMANRLSLGLLVIFIVVFVIYFIVSRKKYLLGASALLSFIIVIILLINFMPRTLKRFKSITNTEFDYSNMNRENHINKEISTENWNGLTLRLAIWSSTFVDASDYLLTGVGTGDYRDDLFKRFEEKGFQYGIEQKYSTHNMYLYYFFVHGAGGLLLFFAIQAYLLKDSIRKRYLPYLVFMAIMLATFFFSNVLNVYAGIIYYVLFISLFLYSNDQGNKEKK